MNRIPARHALAAIWMLMLLLAPALARSAPERLADVAADLRAHGYPSTSDALDRLQHASDVPGADAPVQQRLAYFSALWPLQHLLGRAQELQRSTAALAQMADAAHCPACRFELELLRANQAMDDVSNHQAQGHLDAARALRPAGDTEREQRLLGLESHYNGLQGRYSLGVEQLLRAIALAEADGNVAGKLDDYASLAWMDADLGDLDRAEALGRAALAEATALDYQPLMAWLEVNLGHVYAGKHEVTRERAALEHALKLAEHAPDLLDVKLMSLNNLSDSYLDQRGQQQQAYDLAQRAYQLTHGTRLHRNEAAALANMGIAAAHLGRTDEGVALLRQAIAMSEQYNMSVDVIGISSALVDVYQSAGRYRDALLLLQKSDAVQETVTRQQREASVLDLQEKYAAAGRTQEIKRLSAENAQRAAEVAARAWQQRLWAALAAVLALGSVLLVQTIRRTRTLNRKLAVANETLTEQSMIDPLTRAYNRRHCQELLARLQRPLPRRRQQDGSPAGSIGLLLLDVDFFKQVNDRYGHAAGDAVLIAVAQRLRDLVRGEDAVARWGGEEFLLVLTQTPADGLPSMARRALQAIGAEPVRVDGEAIPVTVSIGTVFLPTLPGRDWEAALGLADAALYQSKSGGRNRATCVTKVAADADVGRLAHDLPGAQAAGELELQVVPGPSSSAGAQAAGATPGSATHASTMAQSRWPERSRDMAPVESGMSGRPPCASPAAQA